MLRRLLSTVFWIYLCLSCVVLFAGALVVFALTFPFDRNGRVLHLYSCFWAQLYFYSNPVWRMRVQGRHHIPWRGAAVLAANHLSLADVLALFALYRPFKWVSKASVFKVPFVGWNMHLNRYVPLVRGDKDSIARMMATCARWLDRGVAIAMFPEGTRSVDGEVKAFKDGAFRLAIAKGCPVIPVVIAGTNHVLPKHGFVLRERADCVVRVLPPVDVAPFGQDVAALREHVRGIIIEEKARVDAERHAARGRQRVRSSTGSPLTR